MCLYPRYAIYNNGIQFISYTERNDVYRDVDTAEVFFPFSVPCGKCIECAQDYTREWTFRILDEMSKYDKSCFLTLTYDSEHLPSDGSLVKRDYQLFLKRFRKNVCAVRYFGCGEYGGLKLRPHFHIILFGYYPDDAYFWCKSKSGEALFRSPTIEKLWPFGFSYVGAVSFSSAKYCAKYLQKYLFENDVRLKGKQRPFTFMSTHPGIGGDYTRCLSTDKLYEAGKWVKTPRYYLKKAEADGVDLTALKANRRSKSVFFDRTVEDLERRRKNSKNFLKKY